MEGQDFDVNQNGIQQSASMQSFTIQDSSTTRNQDFERLTIQNWLSHSQPLNCQYSTKYE